MCKCGKPRPYRKAVCCAECWAKIPEAEKKLIKGVKVAAKSLSNNGEDST